MAMMARMRSLAPWFIITVGGLFVLFMVLSDSQLVDIMGMQRTYVGEVNGEPVTYQEFNALVEQAKVNQEQQLGTEIDESQMDFFREQVWEALVNRKLVEEKIDEFGIIVTDEEIRESILGPNPPQYLTQGFVDSTGQFDRQSYEQAILDPRNKEILIQAEEGIRQGLIQQKLQSYLTASIVVSQAEIEKQYVDNNVTMNARYAMYPVSAIADTQVNVTDADVRNFYDEHIEDYKVDAQRKLKYVVFSTRPSKTDTSSIMENLNAIVKKLKEDTSSFQTYVDIYSDMQYSVDTMTIAMLGGQAGSALEEANDGEIVGPVLSPQGAVVYKLIDKIKSKDTFVRASHILVSTNTLSDEEAQQKANQVYEQLQQGADFARLAQEVSEDPGSAIRGGDLGWFAKGQMVPEFEQAAFSGKVGEVQKPVKTNYGYHIIKTTGKSDNKFAVARIVNSVQASGSTIDKAYEDASDFAYLADKNSFEEEAELLNYDIAESPAFSKTQGSIPGLGSNTALVRWAFDNSEGELSEVYKVPAGYVVAKVTEAKEAGYQPLEEVEANVRRQVINEKKLEKTFEELKSVRTKLTGADLEAAKQYNNKIRTGNANNFKPGGNVPGIGRDYAFIAYALEAEQGKISQPVKGQRGSYLILIDSRTEFDTARYQVQKNIIRDQLLQQKKNRFYQEWVTNLKEEAELVDNRHKFFR